MPELPEVETLTVFLAKRATTKRVQRCELAAFSALKTFDPPLSDLIGTTLESTHRRGKYICLKLTDLWLVMHLARGGWVRWYEALSSTRARPGRGPLALRLGFEDGSGFDVTEAGTEKRLALWVVRDPKDIEAVATLGIDPLSPELDATRLGQLLSEESGSLKIALTRQSVIAGVGNAYSDEALHAARLSPFKPARNLKPDEVERLHDALVSVLRQAVAEMEGHSASDLKGDKHRSMAVHGRTGRPCPVCGDTIRQVSYATKSLQYCPTCQTGGKPLADRRLSRLLK